MLYNYVKKEYNLAGNECFPPRSQIFNAYQKSTFENIKVVIVGQDPYINPGEAMGMCFSINQGVKVPPSLKNIY
jgi:uracil-DNA glycosylase